MSKENIKTMLVIVALILAGILLIMWSDTLAQHYTKQTIPISDPIFTLVSTVLRTIGIILGATAAVSLIQKLLIEEDYFYKWITSIFLFKRNFRNAKNEGFSGLVESERLLESIVNEASTGDNIYYLCGTKNVEFDELIKLFPEIKSKISKKVKFKILYLDEHSNTLERMSGLSLDFVQPQINFIEALKNFRDGLNDEHKKYFDIKRFNDLPVSSLIILEKNSKLFAYSREHFNNQNELPFTKWYCANKDSECKCYAHSFRRYFEHKYGSKSSPESIFHPTGYWVYKFTLSPDNIESKDVYGKFFIFRLRDGYHAEGEAWYTESIQDENLFKKYFRQMRRGTWQSKGKFKKNDNSLIIPYEMILQNPIDLEDSFSLKGMSYHGKIQLNFNSAALTDKVFVKGTIRGDNESNFITTREYFSKIKGLHESSLPNLHIVKEVSIYALRIPLVEISEQNDDQSMEFPSRVLNHFRQLDSYISKNVFFN